MSYAFVVNAVIPGPRAHGIYVTKSCGASENLGNETYLIIPIRKDEFGNYSNEVHKTYDLSPSVKVVRVRYIDPYPLIQILPDRFHWILHSLTTLQFAIKAWFVCHKHNIRVIQSTDVEAIMVFGLLKILYPIKIIFDIHHEPPKWIKFLFTTIDRFIVDAAYFADWLKRRGVATNKIVYLPMGFDSSEYENLPPKVDLRNKFGIPKGRFVVGYIGRYETMGVEKGIFQLLKVAQKLKKKIPLTVYLVGGPDSLAKEYQETALKMNLNPDEFIIHPTVLPAEVPKHIKACDAGWLVYPDNERFRTQIAPMKLLEYAAGKIPVIASNFPSITALFNRHIQLVDPNDTNAQIETINFIYKNPKEIQSTTESLFKEIQKYTWKNRQQKILE